jgi:hypothetical protein
MTLTERLSAEAALSDAQAMAGSVPDPMSQMGSNNAP